MKDENQNVIISIRTMVPEDLNFIITTWLHGYLHGSNDHQKTKRKDYFRRQEKIIKALIEQSKVLIACLQADPDVILSYLVYQDHIIHWAYTKPAWRRLKLITKMLPAHITIASHMTSSTKRFLPKRIKYEKLEPSHQ